MWDIDKFDAIKITIASPEDIKSWSYGEVKKPETINYRSHKPERDGLFCEVIFGPTKDYTCGCGKYKSIRYKGIRCERCNVEVTESKVRRERMGHIELAAPVAHVWYSKGTPSYIALLLDISPKDLEKVLYFNSYIVIDPGNLPLNEKQLLTEKEYRQYFEKYGNLFDARMGAEAIYELLQRLSLPKLVSDLKSKLNEKSTSRQHNILKRLEVAETFLKSGCKPEWMIMKYVPVIPPDLRPMVQLDGGRFATSDLNDLYRRVINRNNRLKKLLEINAPDIIIKNEKRMLQEAVNSLIDNGKRGRPVTGPGKRPLKSLNDMLKGKQGRFRQNLLGKRVDYSGRSVIVVGPTLKLHQCGLPKQMALELFKPFIMNKLVTKGLAHNIKSAKKMLERGKAEIWDLLDEVVRDHPVLLNRAPTLHRLGIQAFEPILVEGKAIKIPPLVCTPFNADFDGDQMAVHVPLLIEAQTEARLLMLSSHNLFSPASGRPIMNPTHDMTLGCYYLTRLIRDNPTKIVKEFYDERTKKTYTLEDQLLPKGNKFYYKLANDIIDSKTGKVIVKKHASITRAILEQLKKHNINEVEILVHKIFSSPEEAIHAYEQGQVKLHTEHIVRIKDNKENKYVYVETCVGRLIFNQLLPPELGFVNKQIDKKGLAEIISSTYKACNLARTAKLLDDIKELGFKYATRSGLSFSIADLIVPHRKIDIITNAEKKAEDSNKKFQVGAITYEEKRQNDIDIWQSATNEVTDEMMQEFKRRDEDGEFNSVYMMAISGARGSMDQVRQLCGMRGLMSNPQGDVIDYPIKSNFRDGLTLTEYFISTYGARKGIVDTALRTADSGYLTRRLVDVAQDVVIREHDCGTTVGIYVTPLREKRKPNNLIASEISIPLSERMRGRIAVCDICHPLTNEVIVKANEEITSDKAKKIENATVVIDIENDDPEKLLGKFTAENVIDPKTDKILLKSDCLITRLELEYLISCRIKYVKIRPAVIVRSPLTCKSKFGICQKCYGNDLSTGKLIELGETAGIIAAQSIGEPGTQLTMRTFHIGGVALGQKLEAIRSNSEGEINVDGLRWSYKVDRKKQAIGNVESPESKEPLDVEKDFRRVVLEGYITITKKDGTKEIYNLPAGAILNEKISNGEKIGVGDLICEYNPNQVITQYKGKVKFNNLLVKDGIVVSSDGYIIIEKEQKVGDFSLETYKIPLGSYLRVNDGDIVEPGHVLAEKIAEQKAAIAGIDGKVEFFDIKIKNQKVISDNGIVFVTPLNEAETAKEYMLPQGVKEFKSDTGNRYGVELKVRSGNEVKKNEELLVITSEIDGEVSIKGKTIHVKKDSKKEYLFSSEIPYKVENIGDKLKTITFISDLGGLVRVIQPKTSASKTLDTRRIIVTSEEEYEIPQDANLVISKLSVQPGANVLAGDKICDEIYFKSSIDGFIEITPFERLVNAEEYGNLDRSQLQPRFEYLNKVTIRDIRDIPLKEPNVTIKDKIIDKILASPLVNVTTGEVIAKANEKVTAELADKILMVTPIGGTVKIEREMLVTDINATKLKELIGKKITQPVKHKKTKQILFNEDVVITEEIANEILSHKNEISNLYVSNLRIKVENAVVIALQNNQATREKLLGKRTKSDVLSGDSSQVICPANTVITEEIREKILADHTIKRIEVIDSKTFDVPENAIIRVKDGAQIKAGTELIYPTHIKEIKVIYNVEEFEIPRHIKLVVQNGDYIKANENITEPLPPVIAKISGKVNYITKYSKKVGREVVKKIIIYSGKEYEIPDGLQIKVKNGDVITENTPLTEPIEFEGEIIEVENGHYKKFLKPEVSEKKYKFTSDMHVLVKDGQYVREGDKLAVLINDKFTPVRSYREKITVSGKNMAQLRYYPVIPETLVMKVNGKKINFYKEVDLKKLTLDQIKEITGTRVSKTIMNLNDGTCIIESDHIIDEEIAKTLILNAEYLSDSKIKLYLPGITINFSLGEIHFEKRIAEEIEVEYSYELSGVVKLIKQKDKQGKELTSIGSIIVQLGEAHQILDGAELKVEDGQIVNKGDIIAKWGTSSKKTIDIIQGLPRVAELFEARKPKKEAIIAEFDGIAKRAGNSLVIESFTGERKQYKGQLGSLSNFLVFDGELVKAGDQLTEGNVSPRALYKVAGVEKTMRYLIDEIQQVYKSQGVQINDKHIEVIVRQMFRKVKIINPGDTRFLPRESVTINEFYLENERVMKLGLRPAEGEQVLQGITQSSLTTDSFISAASFQETTRVLTQASVRGKIDYLRGLKENLIIGKLIPAGTGISAYRNVALPEYAQQSTTSSTSLTSIKSEELAEVMGSNQIVSSGALEADIKGQELDDDYNN